MPGGRDEPDGGLFAPVDKTDPMEAASDEAEAASAGAQSTFKKHETAGALDQPAARKEIAASHGVASRAHDRAAQHRWQAASQKGSDVNAQFGKARYHGQRSDYHAGVASQYGGSE